MGSVAATPCTQERAGEIYYEALDYVRNHPELHEKFYPELPPELPAVWAPHNGQKPNLPPESAAILNVIGQQILQLPSASGELVSLIRLKENLSLVEWNTGGGKNIPMPKCKDSK